MIAEVIRETMRVEGTGTLDPVTVFWEDFEQGKGQVTFICYGSAWTSYWGGMGVRTIKKFFSQCDNDYLANKLMDRQLQKYTKAHEKYLSRIIDAIKHQLTQEGINALQDSKSF